MVTDGIDWRTELLGVGGQGRYCGLIDVAIVLWPDVLYCSC